MENEVLNSEEQNIPAPKVEKISLAELRAEEEKYKAENQKIIDEQDRKYHEEMEKIRLQKDEKAKELTQKFLDSYKALSPEEKKKFFEMCKNNSK